MIGIALKGIVSNKVARRWSVKEGLFDGIPGVWPRRCRARGQQPRDLQHQQCTMKALKFMSLLIRADQDAGAYWRESLQLHVPPQVSCIYDDYFHLDHEPRAACRLW